MGSPTLSIVIPAHNPQERIFRRMLHAVARLDAPERAGVESVIVDNASSPPLRERPSVQTFLSASPGARVVEEPRRGLTNARLAGIAATTGDVLVFDDDNVPAPSYLRVAEQCLCEMPNVGVWGPGTIDVELLDGVAAHLEQRVRETHNERHDRSVRYGCVPACWQPFYPIGMGQVIRRRVADSYRQAVTSGLLSASDRQGERLTSGGDIQIVWQAINMGLSAGVNPDLAMTHVVPGNRATIAYLKRLAFGCGMSYHPAIAESFPEWPGPDALNTRQQARELLAFVGRRCARGDFRFLMLDLSNFIGVMCGRLVVAGEGPDHWMFRLAHRLKLT